MIMDKRPSTYRVFEKADVYLHLAGGLLLISALATGRLGAGSLGFLHGALGSFALAAFAVHAAKGLAGWLTGKHQLTLVAGSRDMADLGRGVLANLGLGKMVPKTHRSYRQRLPYTAILVSAPLLAATGVLAALPGFTSGQFGPGGLLLTVGLHGFFAALAGSALLWHIAFSHLTGEGWNLKPLFTGEKTWEEFAERYPDGYRELTAAEEGGAKPLEQAAEGPGVEELLVSGNALAAKGDFNAAADAFREALVRYPGYPQALFNLGACLYKAGETGEAKEILQQYLEQDAFGQASERARALLKEIAGKEGEG